MSRFNQNYWDHRYQQGETGWDIGYASPALTQYFDSLQSKGISILIPGAGFGYEAQYLIEHGFGDVHVLDISNHPLERLKKITGNPDSLHCHQEDFFDHKGHYELIVEQTFFCALDPKEREAYVEQVFGLLKEGGRLIGLLWNQDMNHDQPPFGGSKEEYLGLFSARFEIEEMELATQSIKPRQGKELFFSIKKTDHSLE